MDYAQGNHPDGILMYKFRETKLGKTKTLGFTGDWEHGKLLEKSRHRLYTPENTPLFNPILIEFLSDCDIIVSDSQFSPAEYYDKKFSRAGWGHPTDEEVIQVVYQAAKNKGSKIDVYLDHYDPSHRDSWINKRRKELQTFSDIGGFSDLVGINYTREGMSVEI